MARHPFPKRTMRKQYSMEEKIGIVLDGLRGEDSITGDIVRRANTGEVTELRRKARDLKEVAAEQTLEQRH